MEALLRVIGIIACAGAIMAGAVLVIEQGNALGTFYITVAAVSLGVIIGTWE